MAQITQITNYNKSKYRLTVYLDGKKFCTLDRQIVENSKIKEFDFVDKIVLINLQFDNERDYALKLALNYLSKYSQPKKIVEKYLYDKGFVSKVVHYAVEKLEGYGYIKDELFCDGYIQKNISTKGLKRIKYELKRKGVASQIIEEKVANYSMEDESEGCIRYLNKYFSKKDFTYQNQQKAICHLLAKGYDYSTIKNSIKIIEGER